MKRLENLTKSKKITGIFLASLLMVGSLGATALAAQGTDIVKKDVVMTESQAPTNNEQTGDSHAVEITPGTITEAQAKQIGAAALQEAYGSLSGLKEYGILDQRTGEQPIWVLYWTSQEFTVSDNSFKLEFASKGPVTIYGARIDAKTGKVMNLVDKSFGSNQ